jgi:tellurite methyltransferase
VSEELMTEHDEWNTKHRAQRAAEVGDPDPFVSAALDHLGPGAGRRAWDLAAGRGRHALELARRGYSVTALDRSVEALEQLTTHAGEAGMQIDTQRSDLEAESWATGLPAAELIVVVNYLDRGLFASLPGLLTSGGHLLITTFTTDRGGSHPSERWCLRPRELAETFSSASIELEVEREGRAGILARIGVSGR